MQKKSTFIILVIERIYIYNKELLFISCFGITILYKINCKFIGYSNSSWTQQFHPKTDILLIQVHHSHTHTQLKFNIASSIVIFLRSSPLDLSHESVTWFIFSHTCQSIFTKLFVKDNNSKKVFVLKSIKKFYTKSLYICMFVYSNHTCLTHLMNIWLKCWFFVWCISFILYIIGKKKSWNICFVYN